mgnify:CR=1 FL=1
MWGTQTALVVGLDAPIHTDRDARIKLQFHWQRKEDHPDGGAEFELRIPRDTPAVG